MDPYRANFLQCSRSLILALQAEGRIIHPLLSDSHPSQETIRFTVHNTLGFPDQVIMRLDLPTPERPYYKMQVTFTGMTGPMGVLPNHYTERVIERIHAKDTALADFFDIYNDRAIFFLYLSWEKYRLYIGAERGDSTQTKIFTSMAGRGTEGLQNRMRVPDTVMLSHIAHWVQEPNLENLRVMLNHALQLPVRVESFQGHYRKIADDRRPTLGDREGIPNPALCLGDNFLLDDEAPYDQGKIRLCIGPLTYAQFERLMPNGDLAIQVVELTESFIGPFIDFDLALELWVDQAPPFELDGPIKPRVGWNSFFPDPDRKENWKVEFSRQEIREHAPADEREQPVLQKTKFYTPSFLEFYQKENVHQQKRFVELGEKHPKTRTGFEIGAFTIGDPFFTFGHRAGGIHVRRCSREIGG